MKPAHILTLAFLVLVAVGHALRVCFQWPVVIDQIAIPMWPSVLAIIVMLGLAVALWRETPRLAA